MAQALLNCYVRGRIGRNAMERSELDQRQRKRSGNVNQSQYHQRYRIARI